MITTAHPISDRSRRWRTALIVLSSISFILALILIGHEQWGNRVPALFALGVVWRILAHAWPDSWFKSGERTR